MCFDTAPAGCYCSLLSEIPGCARTARAHTAPAARGVEHVPKGGSQGCYERGGDALVTSFRVVVRDGWYNAFTDLALWKDYYWLAYRRGTGHGAPLNVGGAPEGRTVSGGNSFAVILRSTDLRRWHEAKMFEPPDGIVDKSGMRTARFCPTDERLYAFIPVQTPREAGRFGRLYCTWTDDGVRWAEPELVRMGDRYPFTFRVRHHDGRFYSAINNASPENALDLITSDDGTNWTAHARIAAEHPKLFTDESELHWLPDGELWCVVRSNSGAFDKLRTGAGASPLCTPHSSSAR